MRTASVILAAGLLLLGCRGADTDPGPDQLTIYSIDGTGNGKAGPGTGETLYDMPVLGKVEITDPGKRRDVWAAVQADLANGAQYPKKCFEPRHALRVVRAGVTTDLVICYQCSGHVRYRDGQREHLGEAERFGSMAAESEPLLSKFLTDAGIPIAP